MWGPRGRMLQLYMDVQVIHTT